MSWRALGLLALVKHVPEICMGPKDKMTIDKMTNDKIFKIQIANIKM
jgi:hypothetical protein